MFVIALVFAIAGFAATVDSFPSNDFAFPGEINEVKPSPVGKDRFQRQLVQENRWNRERYPILGNNVQDDFRPPNSRPLGSRPYRNPRPRGPQGPTRGSQSVFSRPGNDFRPQDFRPSGGFNPQGPGDFRPSDSNPRPQFSRPGGNSYPSSFQPDFLAIGSSSNPQSSNQNSGSNGVSSVQASSTEGVDVETTTLIPRRDPTYRIVYTPPCQTPCSYTREYQPVCGSDGQTYGNIGVLQCAQRCPQAQNVKVFLNGSCGRNNGHPGTISLKY